MGPKKSVTPAIQQWPSPGKSVAARPPADTPPEPATSPPNWQPHTLRPVSPTSTISSSPITLDDLGLTYHPFPPIPVDTITLFQAGARIALKNIETLFLQHPGANLAEIVKGLMDSTDDEIAGKEVAGGTGDKNWRLEGRKWASESFGRNWVALVGGADEARCDAWVEQRGDASWKVYDKGIGAAHSAMEELREAGESRIVECIVRVLEKWIVLQVEAAQKTE